MIPSRLFNKFWENRAPARHENLIDISRDALTDIGGIIRRRRGGYI